MPYYPPSSSSPLTTKGDIYTYSTVNDRLPVGADGTVLSADSSQSTGLKYIAAGGTGTVTSVSVATANGVSGSVANATTIPAITLTLGAITPTTVNGLTISTTTGTLTIASGKTLTANNNITIAGTDGESLTLTKGLTVTTNAGTIAFSGASKTLTVADNASVSGTNTGDQTITLTSDVTGSGTGSFATTIKSSVTLSGNPITTTQASTDNSTRIATTAYVTTSIANAVAGVNPAVAVQAATTAASDTSGLTYFNGVAGIGATFTGSNNTAITVDGYTFTALGQRLLVKNDTQSPSGAFNGVYYVTQIQTAILPPILTRALDYDMPSDINNTGAIPVVNGTANALTSWLLTSSVTAVGTDPLTYTQFSYSPLSVLPPNLGGTGIANNVASTLTISGNYATTLTITGTTGVTLPTSGTLATLAGTETLTNKVVSDLFHGNNFQSQSATAHSATLLSSTNFLVNDVLEIGSTVSLTLPATSTLEVKYTPGTTDVALMTNKITSDVLMGNTFMSTSATLRNILLLTNTKFQVENDVEIGASYTLEVPVTSSLEIIAYSLVKETTDTTAYFANGQFDYIESGCVWSGDAYGVNNNASMTAGFAWIGGKRLVVNAVASRAFTASRDVYVDFTDASNGFATIVYTDNTNNNASPALAAGLRNAIVVTGASSIAASTSINQGQVGLLLPIASSQQYEKTDSLGNLINPRDPQRRVLGYRQITSVQGSITTETDITGLSCPVIVPANRDIKITTLLGSNSSVVDDTAEIRIKEGSTVLNNSDVLLRQSGISVASYCDYEGSPSVGAHTYKVSLTRVIGTGTLATASASTRPTFIRVELV